MSRKLRRKPEPRPTLGCPQCGEVQVAERLHRDPGADVGGGYQAGDVGVCARCGLVMKFTDDGLRPLTATERVDVQRTPAYMQALRSVGVRLRFLTKGDHA